MKPLWFEANPVAFSLAESRAQREAVEAVSWMTPAMPSGRPSIRRSHSSTRSSSSAAAGEVCQIMHWEPRPAVRISARTEAGLLLAGK